MKNKTERKKAFNLILQSKGGAGKSFLTYLLGLKHEHDSETFFVDLDKSTRTSESQLQFLISKKRVANINLTNRENKIDRERLFNVLEHLNEMQHDTFFLDCGAPESEQLPSLFTVDFTPDELKEFEQTLNGDIIFNVVIAGGSAYVSCMNYLEEILILKDLFKIYIYINQYTFNTTPELINEVENNARELGIEVRKFGNIFPDRASGQEILINAKKGLGMSSYSSFAAKTQLKRELKNI